MKAWRCTKQAQYKKRNPWVRYVEWARRRCKDVYNGIECHLNSSDVKKLWMRDEADKLKKPSLDRIDPALHYTMDNCRFIEFFRNIRRPHDAALNDEKTPDWVTEGL